ncbi:MAG: hypothetical protein NC548_22360 [Lachnospiraceae bacterium]|nr:hypothetical protein [Lachnospiraceae bacterium]
MGEVQLWQTDGLGADRDTLEKVIRIFKSDGVQGIESQQALEKYIKTLSHSSIRDMCEIDEDAAMQILVDCCGASKAFTKAADALGYVTKKTAESMGWINPAAYAEVTAKYEERIKKLNEEKDKILSDYTYAGYKAEEAIQRIKELRDALAHYKADLYDFYAQAGKLPNYERGYTEYEQE